MDFKCLLSFLRDLSSNNNRDWFNDRKSLFLDLKNDFESFTDMMIQRIYKIDSLIGSVTAKDCVFRIYRDVRFSLNKDPYKIHFGAYISNGGRKGRFAGYYLHVQPGESFVAAGAYQPQPNVLNEIRYEILDNIEEFKKIIDNKTFKKYFGSICGEKSKIVPKGFPKEFPDIELIKFKSYEIAHFITDDELISNNFENYLLDVIKAAYPYNQFMNRVIQSAFEQDE